MSYQMQYSIISQAKHTITEYKPMLARTFTADLHQWAELLSKYNISWWNENMLVV